MKNWQTQSIARELIYAAQQDVEEREDGMIFALERHLTFLNNHLTRSVSQREAQSILVAIRRQISLLLESN